MSKCSDHPGYRAKRAPTADCAACRAMYEQNHPKLDPNLCEFATEREWELLEAWERLGTREAAAEELGVVVTRLTNAKNRVIKKAARRGYSPEHLNFHGNVIPKGFVLRGQSALVDRDNRLNSRWDKTKQEGMNPDDAHKLPDPKKTVKLSTMTDADGRVIVQWIAEKPEDIARERAWREFARELAEDIPRVKPIHPPEDTNEKCPEDPDCPQCDDGIDNDEDELTDFDFRPSKIDPECESPFDDNESA